MGRTKGRRGTEKADRWPSSCWIVHIRRYYFHVRWPGRKDDDPTGMWLADDPTARDYAEQLINEMKEGEGHDPNLTMVVERAGTVLFTLQE